MLREEERETLLPQPKAGVRCPWALTAQTALALVTALVLVVLQGSCLSCVFKLALACGVLTTCSRSFFVPFLLCAGALLWHTYDYRKGSLRVEVPMEAVVPSWSDVKRYSSYVNLYADDNATRLH
jgi:hypothetical protein